MHRNNSGVTSGNDGCLSGRSTTTGSSATSAETSDDNTPTELGLDKHRGSGLINSAILSSAAMTRTVKNFLSSLCARRGAQRREELFQGPNNAEPNERCKEKKENTNHFRE